MLAINDTSFDAYLRRIRDIPILDIEEERTYLTRYVEQGCLESANKIITHNLRYVVHVAKRYVGYGVPLSDLVQEGNLALMKALTMVNLSFHNRFCTFASYYIVNTVREYCIRNMSMIHKYTTKPLLKLLNHRHEYDWSSPEIEKISKDLNVTVEEVNEFIERQYSSYHDVDDEQIFDAIYTSTTPEDIIARMDDDKLLERISKAITQLDERSRDIVTSRYIANERVSLDALSKRYGISKERVRQIEIRSLKLISAQIVN